MLVDNLHLDADLSMRFIVQSVLLIEVPKKIVKALVVDFLKTYKNF